MDSVRACVEQILPVDVGCAEGLVELRRSEAQCSKSLRSGKFGNRSGGCVIVDLGFGVNEVQGLPEVALRKQIATESSNISYLQREPVRQLSSHGEINRVGIRRFDGLVNSPSDGLSSRIAGGRRLRKSSWRRRLEVRTAELVGEGDAVDGITAGTTGATDLVLNASHLSGAVHAARIR